MTTTFVPTIHSTTSGTLYLKEPGVALVAQTSFDPSAATPFVNSYDDTFDATDYENDWFIESKTDLSGFARSEDGERHRSLDDGAALCKLAGQLCYLSFGDKRTRNKDAKMYFNNIKDQAHGSVLEHASYSFVVWGIDRACSHELVRHRAGFAYSQLSQRYVSGKTLRFVERPEYQNDKALHAEFEDWIDRARLQYDMRASRLLHRTDARATTSMTPTERRKAVNQAARNCLPNETETALVVTGNARAWRHFLEMRGSQHADRPIATVAQRVLEVLRQVSPILFGDYVVGTVGDRDDISTQYRKV
jgi:thymidylate synthase (FAD)